MLETLLLSALSQQARRPFGIAHRFSLAFPEDFGFSHLGYALEACFPEVDVPLDDVAECTLFE